MGYVNGIHTPNETTKSRREHRLATQRFIHISAQLVPVYDPILQVYGIEKLVWYRNVIPVDQRTYKTGNACRSLRRSRRIPARQMRKADKAFRREVNNWF